MPLRDCEWKERARCLGLSPDLFFPEPEDAEGIAAASAICAPCPVRDECLADALSYPREDRFGIQGGVYHTPVPEINACVDCVAAGEAEPAKAVARQRCGRHYQRLYATLESTPDRWKRA